MPDSYQKKYISHHAAFEDFFSEMHIGLYISKMHFLFLKQLVVSLTQILAKMTGLYKLLTVSSLNGLLPKDELKINQRSYKILSNSAF